MFFRALFLAALATAGLAVPARAVGQDTGARRPASPEDGGVFRDCDACPLMVRVPSEDGPFGARAVAEPPGFGPPAAIANAIYDAVGVRIRELPLSGERVLAALRGEGDEVAYIGDELDELKRAEGLGG